MQIAAPQGETQRKGLGKTGLRKREAATSVTGSQSRKARHDEQGGRGDRHRKGRKNESGPGSARTEKEEEET